MDQQPPRAGLTGHDALVMQQVSSFMANDFQICDTAGVEVGRFAGTDSAGARFFKGPRQFALYDNDARVLLTLDDVPNFGFDTFELSAPDGRPLATIRSRFSLFRTRVSVEVSDGWELELSGNLMDYNFEIVAGGRPTATVSRQWAGMGKAFLGHSQYLLSFDPTTTAQGRLVVIGAVLALDLLRMKRQRNNAAN